MSLRPSRPPTDTASAAAKIAARAPRVLELADGQLAI